MDLVCTYVEEGIGVILMNDPDRLNPLNLAMDDALLEALKGFEKNEEVKVIVIGGKGRAFSAGGDMEFFHRQIESRSYENLDNILLHVNRLILYIKQMQKLVIAAVQGHAAGGGANLALASDFIIADSTIKLSEPFTKIGLAPDAGGMYLLSKAVGARKALEICVEHPVLDAGMLTDLHLITCMADDGKVLDEALSYARHLADGPLKAYELAKKQNTAVNYQDLEEYLAGTERETMYHAFRSDDFAESVRAFLEKRKPVYKGK